MVMMKKNNMNKTIDHHILVTSLKCIQFEPMIAVDGIQKIDLNLLYTHCKLYLFLTSNNTKRSENHTCQDPFLRSFLLVACTQATRKYFKINIPVMKITIIIIILIAKPLLLPTCCITTSNNTKQRQSTVTLFLIVL